MTIRQVEEQTGLSRANIRFYESEGLLHPARLDNGYRDYAEEDVQILLRVKLLRTLRLPIEEVRALQTGEKELRSVLQAHGEALSQEADRLVLAQRVCQAMREDGAQYGTLEAQRYLDALEQGEAETPSVEKEASVLAQDVEPRVQAPVRRFVARLLDIGLARLLVDAVLYVIFHMNPQDISAFWATLASMLVLLIVEPLLLHYTGTTAGKWIMGLRVKDINGGRLSVSAARSRTLGVLWYGLGLNLPIYILVRLWKSYRACADGEPLSWEDESLLVLRDQRKGRYALAALGAICVIGMDTLFGVIGFLPPNRWPLTVAEFAENYNFYCDYYHMSSKRLDSNGQWMEPAREPGVVVVELGPMAAANASIFRFETDRAGQLTRVTLEKRLEPAMREEWEPCYSDLCVLATLAMVKAQPEIHWLTTVSGDRPLHWMMETPLVSFTHQFGRVALRYEADYHGYELLMGVGDFFVPREGEEQSMQLLFTLETHNMEAVAEGA